MDDLERALRGEAVDAAFVPADTAPLPTGPIPFPPENLTQNAVTQGRIPEAQVRVDEQVNRRAWENTPTAAGAAAPVPTARRRRLGNAGCAVALASLLGLGLCLVMLFWLPRWTGLALSRTPTADPAAGLQTAEASAPPGEGTAATNTLPPAATPATSPTPTANLPAISTDTPPPPANIAQLVFASYKDDSLFVINPGPYDISLEPLQIGGSDGSISGAEWGVDKLAPGQCVSVWKEEGKPKAPGGVSCEEVGNRVGRRGKQKFWNGTFPVYYAGQPIGECNGKSGSCQIQFPLTPPP